MHLFNIYDALDFTLLNLVDEALLNKNRPVSLPGDYKNYKREK